MASLPLSSASFSRHRTLGRGALAGLMLFLAACSTNPATGERQFTGLLPAEQAAQMGAQEHPKILAQFGGPYENERIQAYVQSLGQRLVRLTETPDQKFTFTVLDSDVVNAFALPGGYVYVTRGLLALANSEAQLAGVIGHEIAHITARHTAERYSQTALAQAGSVLATIFGGQQLGQVAQMGSGLVLAGWSRGQELEADRLGIRYMARAGFDPTEMASFLDAMGKHARLEAALAGQPEAADSFSYLQTHPPTGQRVQEAEAEVAMANLPPGTQLEVRREPYLRLLDNVTYGDSPENGMVRGRTFVHPGLGFIFQVPEGYRIINGEQQVIGVGPDRSAMIVFDAAPAQGIPSPEEFIVRAWAPQAPLRGVERLDVNGLPAATAATTAQTERGPLDARLVAIRFDQDTYYRFLFVSQQSLDGRAALPLRETTYSFRRLSAGERNQYQPHRIQVREVRPGQTAEDFARMMPFDDYPLERFLALNNLSPGSRLEPGQLVKVVSRG